MGILGKATGGAGMMTTRRQCVRGVVRWVWRRPTSLRSVEVPVLLALAAVVGVACGRQTGIADARSERSTSPGPDAAGGDIARPAAPTVVARRVPTESTSPSIAGTASAGGDLVIALHNDPPERPRRSTRYDLEEGVAIGEFIALLSREHLVIIQPIAVKESPDRIRLQVWESSLVLALSDESAARSIRLSEPEVIEQSRERFFIGGFPMRWSVALADRSAHVYYSEAQDILMGRLAPCDHDRDVAGARVCGILARSPGGRPRWLSSRAEMDAIPSSIATRQPMLGHWRSSLDRARARAWRGGPRDHVTCSMDSPIAVFRAGEYGVFRLQPVEVGGRRARVTWTCYASNGRSAIARGEFLALGGDDDGIAFGPFTLMWSPGGEGGVNLGYPPGYDTWIAPLDEPARGEIDLEAAMENARLYWD